MRFKLHDLKTKVEGKVVQLEALLVEKDENLKFIATELKRTQKMLGFLNKVQAN